MAPEVVSLKEYNEKCDMWSCGVLAYTLLCGQVPFTGLTKQEVTDQVKAGEIEYDCIYRQK